MIDTLVLHTLDFEIAPENALAVRRADLLPATGELVRGESFLFLQGGREVCGCRAYLNTPEGIGATIKPTQRGPALLVQMSAGRVLRGVNVEPASLQETLQAVDKAQGILEANGLKTGLPGAQIARLDLCRNAELTRAFPAYQPLLESLQGRRMNQRIYSGQGALWGNRQQELCIYDKGLESEKAGGPAPALSGGGCLARAEARFLHARKVRAVVGCDTLPALCSDSLQDAHREAMKRVFRADMPDTRLEGLADLLESNPGITGLKRYLQITGVQNVDPGAVASIIRAVYSGPAQKMTRKRNLDLLERVQAEACALSGGGWPDLYAELRRAFHAA